MSSQHLFPAAIAISLATIALPVQACEPRVELLGAPAPAAAAARTIVITPDTKHVNVTGRDVVTFVAGGKSFTWAFQVGEGITSFDLNRVAPQGMLAAPVAAYVAPDLHGLLSGDRHW